MALSDGFERVGGVDALAEESAGTGVRGPGDARVSSKVVRMTIFTPTRSSSAPIARLVARQSISSSGIRTSIVMTSARRPWRVRRPCVLSGLAHDPHAGLTADQVGAHFLRTASARARSGGCSFRACRGRGRVFGHRLPGRGPHRRDHDPRDCAGRRRTAALDQQTDAGPFDTRTFCSAASPPTPKAMQELGTTLPP